MWRLCVLFVEQRVLRAAHEFHINTSVCECKCSRLLPQGDISVCDWELQAQLESHGLHTLFRLRTLKNQSSNSEHYDGLCGLQTRWSLDDNKVVRNEYNVVSFSL